MSNFSSDSNNNTQKTHKTRSAASSPSPSLAALIVNIKIKNYQRLNAEGNKTITHNDDDNFYSYIFIAVEQFISARHEGWKMK